MGCIHLSVQWASICNRYVLVHAFFCTEIISMHITRVSTALSWVVKRKAHVRLSKSEHEWTIGLSAHLVVRQSGVNTPLCHRWGVKGEGLYQSLALVACLAPRDSHPLHSAQPIFCDTWVTGDVPKTHGDMSNTMCYSTFPSVSPARRHATPPACYDASQSDSPIRSIDSARSPLMEGITSGLPRWSSPMRCSMSDNEEPQRSSGTVRNP